MSSTENIQHAKEQILSWIDMGQAGKCDNVRRIRLELNEGLSQCHVGDREDFRTGFWHLVEKVNADWDPRRWGSDQGYVCRDLAHHATLKKYLSEIRFFGSGTVGDWVEFSAVGASAPRYGATFSG